MALRRPAWWLLFARRRSLSTKRTNQNRTLCKFQPDGLEKRRPVKNDHGGLFGVWRLRDDLLCRLEWRFAPAIDWSDGRRQTPSSQWLSLFQYRHQRIRDNELSEKTERDKISGACLR